MGIGMEYKKSSWVGIWENFECYFDSTEEEMVATWEAAENACKSQEALSKMFANGCKAFWQMACSTINGNNTVRLGGFDVVETEEGLQITWYDAEDEELGTYEYVFDSILEKGLEGKENVIIKAVDAPQGCPFRWLLMMEPMPDRSAKNEGGLISHFHYQFGASYEELVVNGALKNPRWYATMCDQEVTVTQKCNIVRALHKMPVKK